MSSTLATIVTNVAATCRYSAVQGVDFSNMQGMFMDQGTSHVTTLSNLTPGPNTFYVRCQDTSGNTNSSDFFWWMNLPGN